MVYVQSLRYIGIFSKIPLRTLVDVRIIVDVVLN